MNLTSVFLPALQRIRSTVDEKEQKQLLMDLDVVMRSSDCPYIVQFYGALFREVTQTHRSSQCLKDCFCVCCLLTVLFLCLSSGRLLDMYGTNVYLPRQILQICILCIRWCDSRGNIRKNYISSKSRISYINKSLCSSNNNNIFVITKLIEMNTLLLWW